MSAAADKPWVTTTRSGKRCYHSDDACEYLGQSPTKPRSQHYVDWHDLDPCPECVGGDDDE